MDKDSFENNNAANGVQQGMQPEPQSEAQPEVKADSQPEIQAEKLQSEAQMGPESQSEPGPASKDLGSEPETQQPEAEQLKPETQTEQSQSPQDQAAGETSGLAGDTQAKKKNQKTLIALIAAVVVILVAVIVIIVISLGNNGNSNGQNAQNVNNTNSDSNSNSNSQAIKENTKQNGNKTDGNAIDDSYFVSDDTKYVFTLDSGYFDTEDSEVAEGLVKIYIVCTYSGEKVTGMKYYVEYVDETAAKKAYGAAKDSGEDASDYALDGKYLIMTMPADQYEGLTPSDIKEQFELMEKLNNMDDNVVYEEDVDEGAY